MSATARNGRAPRVPLITPVPAPIEPPSAPTTSTPNLDAALLAFAADAPKLRRDATGQVGGKNAPPRLYGYASLDGVLDDVAPLLIKHCLVWKVRPTIADGQPAARYSMTHVPSGEIDEDVMPLLGAVTPQTLGSALTYMRRYGLIAYLNLAPGEDDDGAAASQTVVNTPAQSQPTGAQSQPNGAQSSPQPQARPPAAQPQAKPPADGQGTTPASVKQRQMIRTRAGIAGLSSSQLADVILRATGNEPRGMDAEVATRWLHMGLERLPARAVDAVLDGITNGGAQS